MRHASLQYPSTASGNAVLHVRHRAITDMDVMGASLADATRPANETLVQLGDAHVRILVRGASHWAKVQYHGAVEGVCFNRVKQRP